MPRVIAERVGTHAGSRKRNETQHPSLIEVVNVDADAIGRLEWKEAEADCSYRARESAMYEKMLLNKEIVYFIYAPPVTDLDQIDEKKRPKKAFSNANKWESSVFYYWWLFLRENDEYRKTCHTDWFGRQHSLFKDFGDIHATDFMTWWKERGRDLFREPQSEGVRVNFAGQYDKDRVNISIPMTGDLERSLAEIRSLLQPVLKNYRIVAGPSKAKYPVASKPVLSSLYKIYNIYLANKNDPDLNPGELFEKLKLSTAIQSKESQASTVSRALKQAKFIIEHVGKGIFPVMNKAQLASAQNMLENRMRLRNIERNAKFSVMDEQDAARQAAKEFARRRFFSSNRDDG